MPQAGRLYAERSPRALTLAVCKNFCVLHAYQILSGLSLHFNRLDARRRGRATLKSSTWERIVEPEFETNPLLDNCVLAGEACGLRLYWLGVIIRPGDFGRDFATALEASSFSLSALERKTGLHRNTLKRILAGKVNSNLGTLCMIVRAFPETPDLRWLPDPARMGPSAEL